VKPIHSNYNMHTPNSQQHIELVKDSKRKYPTH